ncbi:MAG: PqqD family peptide modification chaperone [Gemmatimonadota bacterium]
MTKRISRDARVRAVSTQVSSDLGGEVVVLELGAGKYFGLDDVAARVWSLLQSPITVGELESALLAEYDVDARRCAEDLDAFLRELADRNLVSLEAT